MAYDCPGNVRELQNATERSVVLSVDGRIDEQDMFAHLSFAMSPASIDSGEATDRPNLYFDLPLTDAKQAYERRYLDSVHESRLRRDSWTESILREPKRPKDLARMTWDSGL